MHDLRNRQTQQSVVHRHGVSGRNDAEAPHCGASSGVELLVALSIEIADALMRLMPPALSIATSSRRTSSSPSADMRRFSILAWPRSQSKNIDALHHRNVSDHSRNRNRHGELHVAGTSSRQGVGRTYRSVLLRRGHVRDVNREIALSRGEHGSNFRGHFESRTGPADPA